MHDGKKPVQILMPITEFDISIGKGQAFYACEWSPAGVPKAMILLIHGLSDHAGRYHHVGSYFAASGYVMIIADLRGNGKSFGKRGHFILYKRIMDDISMFIKEARIRHPALPLVIYGHSMGGNLVLNYLIRHKPDVTGAIVTSPWLRLTFKPPLYKVIMAKLVNKVFPSITQADGVIPSYLSHDREVTMKYIADPLVHSRISVRTFLEISNAGEYALSNAEKVGCPLLLMHGTEDSLTSFSASLEFSNKMIVSHTFKAWDGLFHELHNETGKEAVLGFIREWTDSLTSL
ncbi:MAG: lysophospholipase [Candidatus Taylorbacteria bacterium]